MARFQTVFVAVFVGTALVVASFLLHKARPAEEVREPSAQMVKATGKCVSCHRRETGAVVHQFEKSRHARKGVTCLDCHRPVAGQEKREHRGFVITRDPTSANCRTCHKTQYEQFRRSRHGAPAWAAVKGREPFTEKQIAFAEKHHPGAVDRPANKLAQLEGPAAMSEGCASCHSIGRPNPDGSIGECTKCHGRHRTSLKLARLPRTCGQCHMGPDHAQLEIYQESKHGVLFNAQRDEMNLDARPQRLTTEDMPVPTCATCHMSGLEGEGVTHDVGERLSWYLFAPVSEKRDHYEIAQREMQAICMKCHAESQVEGFYEGAESVLASTNEKVRHVRSVMDGLNEAGLLTEAPFDEPIEFTYFDFWHYYGRTAKHGAFMGGADFVQWHGNYELLLKKIKIEHAAKKLHGHPATRPHEESADDAESPR